MTRRQAAWFVAAYVAIVSIAIWFNLAVLCEGDAKYDRGCGGFGVYIPLWLIFLTPLLLAALALERWRRAAPPPTSRLVAYLAGILLVAEVGFIYVEQFPVLLAIEAGAIILAFLIRRKTA